MEKCTFRPNIKPLDPKTIDGIASQLHQGNVEATTSTAASVSPSTIGDRLYQDAHKFARRKRELAEAAKKKAEDDELKECTFKPKISNFAKELRSELDKGNM